MPKTVVDLNCDMGEAFGHWSLGDTDDAELMNYISSASIAAGFHAGDPNLMDAIVRIAAEKAVGIGVHPGYRDLQGFGRRRVAGTSDEIVNDIVYQIGALREFARRHGAELQHVKPHGALYMEMAANEQMSCAFIEMMRKLAPGAFVFCMGASATYRIALEAGQPAVREFYSDRGYNRDGTIVFTRQVGKPDLDVIAAKCVRACLEGRVRTVEDEDIEIEFESICFHSDTPGSLALARAIRSALTGAGIKIAPASEVMRLKAQPRETSMSVTPIRSHLPGVFYRRPSPDSPPYKTEGDSVAPDDVIGLVEVMKSFHEVKAGVSGKLIRFLVPDADAVMAGQPLAEAEV